MTKGDIETYYEDGQWKNKVQGSRRAAHAHDNNDAAQAKGRKMAESRNVEHHIKKKDSTVGERNSYGNDPSSSPG